MEEEANAEGKADATDRRENPPKRACESKRKHPTTLGELREVDGIGESKAGRLGRELLGMMKLFDGEQPAPQDARTVPTGA